MPDILRLVTNRDPPPGLGGGSSLSDAVHDRRQTPAKKAVEGRLESSLGFRGGRDVFYKGRAPLNVGRVTTAHRREERPGIFVSSWDVTYHTFP